LQIIENTIGEFGAATSGINILNPQDEGTVFCVCAGKQRRPRMAKMQETSR
jgi:hypothetical protein